jgi:hypothetical protein
MNKAGKNASETEAKVDAKASEDDENTPEVNETLEKLLRGEEIFEYIDTRRGKFKIIYPRPRVLRHIQVLLAERFNGQNLNNIKDSTIRNYEVYATLDVVVVEGPKWWDKLESSEDCPDDDLILALYRGYLRFCDAIRRKILGSDLQAGEKPDESTAGDEKAPVGTGAFSGLTNRPEGEGADGGAS